MVAFDGLQRAAFGPYEFLVENVTIVGGVRDHVHEYKRVPGGDTEDFARRLYTFEMDAIFLVDHPVYQNAWPDTISFLRSMFESQTHDILVVPTIGSVAATCIDWTIVNSARMRNGERMRMKFREWQQVVDPSDEFLFQHDRDIGAAATALGAALTKYQTPLGPTTPFTIPATPAFSPDIFDAIIGLANEVVGLAQLASVVGSAYVNKLTSLIQACSIMDRVEQGLNDPLAWEIVATLHELGAAAVAAHKDALKLAAPIVAYTVPVEMSVVDVSMALYQDASRGMEIMNLNPIDNPIQIRPGTMLNVYAPGGVDSLAA